jgi:hypothetical protein
MRNLLTAVLTLLTVGLFSCQKEIDDVFAGNGNSVNGSGLLKRLAIKQGADSVVYDFFYNSSGKIVGVNELSVSSGASEFSNETIERNSQGVIQKVITKASQLSQFGIDSIVATVNSASGHYVSRIVQFSLLGITASFGSFFYYDANGKIVSQKDYVDDGSGSIDSSRLDYTYSGANLISLKGYDLNSGSATPDLTQIFEYDSKPSPLIVANEGFVLNNFYQWYSANNLKKITVNVAGDPDTHIEAWDYIYNSVNKPASANITQDGQTGTTASYYY